MVIHEKGKHASDLGHRLRSLSRPATPTGIPGANREFPNMARVETEESRTQVKVRWNMVFTWQAPIMLMSYSVVFFLLGLTIFVITPLYDGRDFDGESRVSDGIPAQSCAIWAQNNSNAEEKAAIFYIVLVAIGGATFMWCSYWSYRFVELDGE